MLTTKTLRLFFMSRTYYLAHLKCNYCGTISPDDTSTQLSNKACPHNYDIFVKKEDHIEHLDLEDISTDFFRINKPVTNRIVCAEIWSCPTCKNQNFAELVYIITHNDAIMEEIKEVILTPEYFDTLNYLSENIDDWAQHSVFPSYRLQGSLEPTPEEIKNFREFLVRRQEEKKE
jgi:hypothetical protein